MTHPPRPSSPGWLAAGAATMGVLIGGAAVYLGQSFPGHGLGAAMGDVLSGRPESTPDEVVAPADPDPAVAADESGALAEAVAGTRDTVVNLHTPNGALGAGVIVDERGLVVTNFHVIADALEPPPVELFGRPSEAPRNPTVIARFENQREIPAAVLVADREEDLAVLRLRPADDAERFAAAELGASSELRVGEDVFAVGNPFGLPHTVSRGIVSALDRTGILENRQLPVIQLDASINIGNSGGPLFNLDGELVGIVTARRQQAQGIAFALPIDHVRGFLRAVSEPAARRSGVMGVTLQIPNRPGLEAELGPEVVALGYAAGLRVEEVHAGQPAEAAGLKAGDTIVGLRGKRLDGLPGDRTARELATHLQSTVRSMFAGERLAVTVVRNGEVEEIDVEIRPASERDQAFIDAEELLGLQLKREGEAPIVQDVRGGPLERFAGFIRGARIVRLMGNDCSDLDRLGEILSEIRELTRKRGAKITVWLGLLDAQGRTLPDLPLVVR